ncbi:5' nucleotidase, NT5C type [Caenibacillus caldisaponilyticus]|uniref:5' nucleotidase, NT5C type n=1 Tax=Caenibacillus caldisaponilyticus TaxID=1674942 RepID=UPI0009887524|nr:HAD hydrolase-like protein [Caenibacillus caldisaponilyticus]
MPARADSEKTRLKHIGLDFDDTLVDMRKSMVQVLNRLHHQTVIYEEIEVLAVSTLYGYSYDEYVDFFTRNQKILHAVDPFPYVQEVLAKLSAEAKLSIMTGRPKEWMGSVKEWVERHHLPIDAILCASQYPNRKAECASLHQITLFIEDNPVDALALAESGIDVLMIDKPYNRECRHKRMTRVKDWEAIGRLLFS